MIPRCVRAQRLELDISVGINLIDLAAYGYVTKPGPNRKLGREWPRIVQPPMSI
jgi:hypothetical protein